MALACRHTYTHIYVRTFECDLDQRLAIRFWVGIYRSTTVYLNVFAPERKTMARASSLSLLYSLSPKYESGQS